MKNFIRIICVAAVLMAAASCETKRSTADFYLSASFEMTEEDLNVNFVDSLLFLPKYYWEQVSYLASQSLGLNDGYIGGFKISAKKGSPSDDDQLALFTSAGSSAGAGKSNFYAAYYNSGVVPDKDIVFELSSYYSAYNYIVGCYLNNTEYNQRVIDAGKVAQGDFLKVTLTFLLNDREVGSIEKTLIDYSGSELKYVNDWEVWDIAADRNKAGTSAIAYDAVKFTVECSGLLQPCFCLDNFTTQLSVEY